jgi:hypothetical protein
MLFGWSLSFHTPKKNSHNIFRVKSELFKTPLASRSASTAARIARAGLIFVSLRSRAEYGLQLACAFEEIFQKQS